MKRSLARQNTFRLTDLTVNQFRTVQQIKYLAVNRTKHAQTLYAKSHVTLMKEILNNLNAEAYHFHAQKTQCGKYVDSPQIDVKI